jgi:hypothetical protein
MYDRCKMALIVLIAVSGKNYVPGKDTDFVAWARNLYDYANECHERFGIIAVDADVLSRLENFARLVEKCRGADHTRADEVEKKDARKASEKDVRNFVQGSLARNIRVTNRDHEMLRLPVRDTVHTPVGEPVGDVTATVERTSEGVISLHIAHVEGTPYDPRANYGVKVRYGVFPIETVTVDDVNKLTETVFTRRKVLTVKFTKDDLKKMAFFCMRYENSKGQAGLWGPMASAVIS